MPDATADADSDANTDDDSTGDGDDAAASETVVYQFEMDRETWRQWADSVPRSTTLKARLRTLIQQDLNAKLTGGYTEMEERTARLLASRIERRARTAQAAIDRDAIDDVREHLEKIQDIAGTFEQ